jgi:hypothetical protein
MEQTQLPPGWQAVQDPQSGRTYYQNTVTKTTQWEIPGAAGPSPDTQLSGRRSQAELAAIHAASKQQEQQGGSASLTLQQGGGVGGGDGMGDAVSMVISPQPASMTMISAPLSQLNAGGWKNVGAPQVVWEGEAYKEVKVATAEILMIAKTPAGGAAVVAASSSSAEVVSSPPLKPIVIQPCGQVQACYVWFWCVSLSAESR